MYICKSITDKTTWNEAVHLCQSMGYHLAVTDNESITTIGKAVYNIRNRHGQKAWLSGKAVNQKWKWMKFTKCEY